jgi:hypothetical protein
MIIPLLLRYPEHIVDFDIELLDGMEKAVVMAMKEIAKSGIHPTLTIITRELEKLGVDSSVIEWFREQAHEDPIVDMRYFTHELKEQYNGGLYLKISAYINDQLTQKAPTMEVMKGIEQMLCKVKGSAVSSSVVDTAKRTADRLAMIYSGKVPPIWTTGKPKLDELICLGPKQLIMVAAQQKVGKTRFVLELAMSLMERNSIIEGINWYTFEMDDVELTMLLAAYLTMIDSNTVNGRNKIPAVDEQDRIRKALQMLQEMKIRFINRKMDMEELKLDMLTIVDNIGLIRPSNGREGNAHDDYIASELVDVRDRTSGLIFLLHHLGKESVGHFNKENLYRPSAKHSRGSNRLNDYVNTLILLHRVEMYPSLVNEGILSEDDFNQTKGVLECQIPFSRESGATGKTLFLRHNLEFCRSREATREELGMPRSAAEQLSIISE